MNFSKRVDEERRTKNEDVVEFHFEVGLTLGGPRDSCNGCISVNAKLQCIG